MAMTKELTVFSYSGKNYIGYYCSFAEDEKPSFVGIGQEVTDKFIFLAPAEISYDINITSDATADLTSKVMPIFPGPFYNGTPNSIYFAFPKSDTIMSTIKDSTIHDNIVKQYKQLTKLEDE